LRYLAQVAVNMVDYMDNDEYMTPFNWAACPANPAATTWPSGVSTVANMNVATNDKVGQGWVFGTEIPRVVLSEAYTEIDNDTGDTQGTTNFNLNFWVELLNTFQQDPNLANSFTGNAQLQMRPAGSGWSNPYAAYQLVMSMPNANLRTAMN